MRTFLVLFLLLFAAKVNGQTILKGEVHNEQTKEKIPFAKLFFLDIQTGILADSTGNFSFDQELKGSFAVQISANGFESKLLRLDLPQKEVVSISLEPKHVLLDKVIVSAEAGLQGENITNVESMDLADIGKLPVASLGEAIANIPGVYRSSLGAGISRPVVRGLSGPRVVTYLNGLRIENQQWGDDHGIGATDAGLGSVEVIKGPASLLYGADAMGGVVYFVDEPYISPGKSEVSLFSRFDHVTMGTKNQLGLRLNKKGVRVNANAGLSNYADYGLPNGKFAGNSRYLENSAKLSVGYGRKNWVMNLRYNFLNQRIGLPGHTHDSIPDLTEFQWDNQNRSTNVPAQSIYNHFVSLENKFFLKKSLLTIMLGNTTNSLTEYEEKFTIPGIKMVLNNSLYNLNWKFFLRDDLDLTVGSQGMYQLNTNDPLAVEYLIPDSKTLDLGAYALASYKYKKWRFLAGGRFDNRTLEAFETEGKFSSLKRSYQGVNFSAGFSRKGKISSVRFNLSSGFRAPTSSELLSDGLHHGTFRYEIGNPDLISEKALQADLSIGFHGEHLEVLINPFYNSIRDYIQLVPLDSVVEGLQASSYQQVESAFLAGTDVGIHYHPHFAHWLHFESSYSMIYAEDGNGQALSYIPQSRINTQLKFQFEMESKFKVQSILLQHQYHFEQDRVGVYENPTGDYHLLNLSVNTLVDFKKVPIEWSVGVQNLLNEAYYSHLSRIKDLGLYNPGRNIYTSIKFKIK
ncbi:MAG: TonB-dependent receptor [Flavobacteriales bacterium]|nr:TonB-dependent receptor [Flavobacteriales bacterium]